MTVHAGEAVLQRPGTGAAMTDFVWGRLSNPFTREGGRRLYR